MYVNLYFILKIKKDNYNTFAQGCFENIKQSHNLFIAKISIYYKKPAFLYLHVLKVVCIV